MEEVWKDIKDFEGHYQISNLGRVKSLTRYRNSARGCLAILHGRILKNKLNKTGYPTVHLRKDDFHRHPSVHRLVAETFIPNPENKPTVNHKDCDKLNNNLDNLEWADYSEQMEHAVKNNLLEVRGSPKYSKEFKNEILQYYKENNISISKLAIVFSISERTAGRVVNDGVKARPTTRVLRSTGEVIVEDIISKEKVEEIKKLRKEGYTLSKLSSMFDRSISQIHRISKGMSRNNNIE